jgi:WhiB family redox-sensing transcriptional regulator
LSAAFAAPVRALSHLVVKAASNGLWTVVAPDPEETMTHRLDESTDQAPLHQLEWQRDAVCGAPGVDPALFFETDGETPQVRRRREARALALCRRCPVVDECLSYARLEGVPAGVWGGTTAEERLRGVRLANHLRSA